MSELITEFYVDGGGMFERNVDKVVRWNRQPRYPRPPERMAATRGHSFRQMK